MELRNLLFTRWDGKLDSAIIKTKKEGSCYGSSIKIGTITKKVNSGMINIDDSSNAAVQNLSLHKEHVII